MQEDDEDKRECVVLGCRCYCCTGALRKVIAMLLMFVFIILFCQRVVLHIAIVEMVLQVKKQSRNATCPLAKGQSSVFHDIGGGKIDWDEEVQSYVLLSFYIGYTVTQLAAGVICDKTGAKYPLVFCVATSTVTTFLVPITVMKKLHWLYPFWLRLLCGLGQGFAYPAVTTFLARWIPSHERGIWGSVVFSGYSFGIILGNLLSGLAINYVRHWAAPFYIWGLTGVVWLPIFMIWAQSEPAEHRYISADEKALIESDVSTKLKRNVPIGKILSDLSVWGLIIGQIGNNYLTLNLITYLPKYLNNVLNLNMSENSWGSALPFLGMFLSSLACGKVSDYLIMKRNVNVTLLRKVCSVFGSSGPAVFLVLSGYANCNTTLSLTHICLAVLLKGPFYCGLMINGMDLTTHYAGTLMSLSNGIGAIPGFVGPYIIGRVAPNNALHEWHLVYWITFAVANATVFFYAATGKGRRARWDYTDEEWSGLDHTKYKKKWYQEYSPEELEYVEKAREERRLRSLSRTRKMRK